MGRKWRRVWVIHSWEFIHRHVLTSWFGSEWLDSVEGMFELVVPDTADLGALDDAALVDAAGALARGENALCARTLAVMAELLARRGGGAAVVWTRNIGTTSSPDGVPAHHGPSEADRFAAEADANWFVLATVNDFCPTK